MLHHMRKLHVRAICGLLLGPLWIQFYSKKEKKKSREENCEEDGDRASEDIAQHSLMGPVLVF